VSSGLYEQDEAHLKAYVAASRDQKTFDAYLEGHARAGEDAYRERIGAKALSGLTTGLAA
jgi:glutaconate CoA-transferase, subunit A